MGRRVFEKVIEWFLSNEYNCSRRDDMSTSRFWGESGTEISNSILYPWPGVKNEAPNSESGNSSVENTRPFFLDDTKPRLTSWRLLKLGTQMWQMMRNVTRAQSTKRTWRATQTLNFLKALGGIIFQFEDVTAGTSIIRLPPNRSYEYLRVLKRPLQDIQNRASGIHFCTNPYRFDAKFKNNYNKHQMKPQTLDIQILGNTAAKTIDTTPQAVKVQVLNGSQPLSTHNGEI